MHFLKFLGIYIAMSIACGLIVGFFWLASVLSTTGRRKRDLLMLFIPIWGIIVLVQTIWRYTAEAVYWSVRADRPSKTLSA